MPSGILQIVIFLVLVQIDSWFLMIVLLYDVTWRFLAFSWLRRNNMKSRWVWVHGIFGMGHVHLFGRVLAHYAEALPILGRVASSAPTRNWTFGSGLTTSSGVAAYWPLLLWLLVAAEAVSESVGGVCGARCLALASTWEAAPVACLLWGWIWRWWRMVARFLASLLVLLFYDGLLCWVIQHREQVLRMLGSKLLPNEKALTSSTSSIRIGIRNTLLDVCINSSGILVKNSFKWVDADQHEDVLRHFGMCHCRFWSSHLTLEPGY